MRIAVTGGAGFIGSNIVDRLIGLGHDVYVVDNLSAGDRRNVNAGAGFTLTDILNKEALEKEFSNFMPEVCIHHAAQTSVPQSVQDPNRDADINIIGTLNVLNAVRACKARKIIFASSAAVYGEPQYLPIDERHPIDPISCYGISKYASECYIRAFSRMYGIKYTILRYSNVYGIRQIPGGESGVISIFMNSVINGGKPVIFGDGTQTRDFVYVKDVVETNIAALEGGDSEILNIGGGKATTISKLVGYLEQVIGKPIMPQNVPSRPADILHSYMDSKRARTALGWDARYSLIDGLEETYKYYINCR